MYQFSDLPTTTSRPISSDSAGGREGRGEEGDQLGEFSFSLFFNFISHYK